MPLQPMPTTIELNDFSQGWVPRGEEIGVPTTALLDVLNLLPDPVTGSLVTRDGYKRVTSTGFGTEPTLKGHRVYSLHPYTTKAGVHYLICVLSNDIVGVENNVQVWSLNLDTLAVARIDTADRIWANANGRHWGATVDNIFYGGAEDEVMYSWEPTRATPWNDDPGTPTYPVWAEENTTADTDIRARDYAFKKGQSVTYTYSKNSEEITESFSAKRDIRYDKWDDTNRRYKKGDRVSTNYSPETGPLARFEVGANYTMGTIVEYEGSKYLAIADAFGEDLDDTDFWQVIGTTTGAEYWRSFECVERHTPTLDNAPMTGAGKWKKVKLMRPVNDDSHLNEKDWNRVPDAPQTHIAVWHGNRLFARNDHGAGGKQSLVYSRQAKVGDPNNDAPGTVGRVGDPRWDPDDWRAGGADGAGLQPFETKEGDAIQALVSFGTNLLVFKRYTTFVISGTNPDTWTVRPLGQVGCANSRAAVEHEGSVYFISDRGFYKTDGTGIAPADGADKIEGWLREAIKWNFTNPGNTGKASRRDVEMWSHNGLVWITIPTETGTANSLVLVYDPIGASFWPQAMQVQTAAVHRYDGTDQLFLANVNQTGLVVPDYSWTGAPNASESIKTVAAVEVDRNRCPNPSFVGTLHETPGSWTVTDATKVKARVTAGAARRGSTGLHLSNSRTGTGGSFGGYEGVQFITTPPDSATVVAQCMVRRAGWEKDPRKKPDVKLLTNATPDVPDFLYVGRGWWKVKDDTSTIDLPSAFGILTAPGTSVHVDMFLLSTEDDGYHAYFDGYGGEDDYSESGNQLVPILNNPVDADGPHILGYGTEWGLSSAGKQVDDQRAAGYVSIPWLARTAWMTFGTIREERRIRRLWSLLRGTDIVAGLRTFTNFKGGDSSTYKASVSADQPVIYHEGQLPEDCYSVQVEVEGDSAPAALLGVALDTQPRRVRFGG